MDCSIGSQLKRQMHTQELSRQPGQLRQLEDPANFQQWAISSANGSLMFNELDQATSSSPGEDSCEDFSSSSICQFLDFQDFDSISSTPLEFPVATDDMFSDIGFSMESKILHRYDQNSMASMLSSNTITPEGPLTELTNSPGDTADNSDGSHTEDTIFWTNTNSQEEIPDLSSMGHPWSSPLTNSLELSLAIVCAEDALFPACLGSPAACSPFEEYINLATAQALYCWEHNESFDSPSPISHCSTILRSNREGIKARRHFLYRQGPGNDGLYHCQFAKSENCDWNPNKLKCNYEHLDSHLKPYWCTMSGCAEVSFSSTACLLRHEREAHGLHGHGKKPFACTYDGCDRSKPDNGFPRRWNLHDHMRRLHGNVSARRIAGSRGVTARRAPRRKAKQ